MISQLRIRGINFDGTIKTKEKQLALQIIKFGEGFIYQFIINHQEIKKQYKRYLVIKSISELYDELLINQKSRINEEHQLIIPIQVKYRGRVQDLNIEIPLKRLNFEDEESLRRKYIEQIEKLSRQSVNIELYKERNIIFKADPKNPNLKSFDISAHGNLIKYTNKNSIHTIINHQQPLLQKGIHYYKIKINKTVGKQIIVGVCATDIKYTTGMHQSPYFLGLNLSQRTIIGNNKSEIAIQPLDLIEGKSTMKVQVDMNKSVVSWYFNDLFLCARRIPNEIFGNKDIYPIISLYNQGDLLQILND